MTVPLLDAPRRGALAVLVVVDADAALVHLAGPAPVDVRANGEADVGHLLLRAVADAAAARGGAAVRVVHQLVVPPALDEGGVVRESVGRRVAEAAGRDREEVVLRVRHRLEEWDEPGVVLGLELDVVAPHRRHRHGGDGQASERHAVRTDARLEVGVGSSLAVPLRLPRRRRHRLDARRLGVDSRPWRAIGNEGLQLRQQPALCSGARCLARASAPRGAHDGRDCVLPAVGDPDPSHVRVARREARAAPRRALDRHLLQQLFA
mmetsp:Transcript_38604/g.129089  ORF Transcript_38604/g.129089 Transcript_38604/m.129089 type:complete len:264 (-) Transcript_38604:70-861(-)